MNQGPNQPLRILYIVPYPPSLIRVRSYNLIRRLSALGYEVTVLTLYSDESEQADVENFASHCHRVIAFPVEKWRSLWNCLTVVPTSKPMQAVYCWQPKMAESLEELIFSPGGKCAFDVVHIEHLRAAEYGVYLNKLLSTTGRKLPIVWDSVDCISYLFRQTLKASNSLFGVLAARMDLGRTEKYEGWVANQFEQVVIVSETDKQALLNLTPDHRTKPAISIIPNGVDLEYFHPDPAAVREPDTLIFSGKMSYHANVTMALYLVQEIMPHIWRERPQVKLHIVGKAPSKRIAELSNHPNIVVTGTVPDMRPYLRRAAAAVVPLVYGAGTQFKVLEAMACGTPVVTTPQAAAPLAAVPGRDLLVTNDARDFAGNVLRLLEDPGLQQQLGRFGRSYVENHHNWETISTELGRIFSNFSNKDCE